MAADAGVLLVLAVHHRHGVPANQGLDAALERAVARVGNFVVLRDGVEVGSGQLAGDGNAGLAGAGAQSGEQLGALFPVTGDNLVEGFNPLCIPRCEVNLCGSLKLCCHKRSLYPHLSTIILSRRKNNPYLR